MKTTTLKMFEVGDKFYLHVINYDTDATHILDRHGFVYTVNSSGFASDASGKNIGRFTLSQPFEKGLARQPMRWCFVPVSGNIIETDASEIIDAEFIVFKAMLEAQVNKV